MPLDSFAMFIKSSALQFTRLDLMDDIYEAKCDGLPYNPLSYIFASCHTEDDTENIALWKMYSSLDRGVRVELDTHNLFAIYLKPYSFPSHNHKVWDYPSLLWTCLRFEDCTNTDYILIPINNAAKPNDKDNDKFIIHKKIDYIKNLEEHRKQHQTYTKNNEDEEGKLVVDIKDYGFQKSLYWKFQKESRFLIYSFPFSKNEIELQNIIREKKSLDTTHIYAPLSYTALKTMIVRLSPNATDATKFIVYSLLSTIGNTNIEESDLKGHIRS